jgi:predicted alpha/beta-fold hydrolase
MSLRFEIPPFEPHPLFRNPHAQTLAGTYLPGRQFPYRAVHRRVSLPDGDAVVLHDDLPSGWQAGERAALLIHGLAGSHSSAYMVRVAGKLNGAGVRTFRMDLRGCGAGEGLASRPYHAGRSADAIAALQLVEKLCPDSPITLVGFSLSGNIVLKVLGEAPDEVPASVDKAAAISPALDLARCARSLVGPFQRIYDRHFVRLLSQQIRLNRRLRSDLPDLDPSRPIKTLFEFDDAYTGPVCGFGSADNYYATSSAARHVENIRLPTLILAAQDDPLVPIGCFDGLRLPSHVLLRITEHGGHLGYLGKRGVDPDRRWMDWRIVDWITTDLTRQDEPLQLVPASGPSRITKTSPTQRVD